MKKLVMMPWFPESFIASTRGWTLTQRAIYRELLDAQWIQGSLPTDEDELMRLAGATRSEWAKAWPVVQRKFVRDGDQYTNARLAEHLKTATSLQAKRSSGAQKTNAKRYGEESDSAHSATRPALTQRHAQRSHDSDSDSSVLRTGGDPPDPRKEIFDLGIRILGSKHRSLIGKAISEVGESRVGEILGGMAVRPPVDPVPYFIAAAKPKERGVVV